MADFRTSILKTLVHEGGYVNNPNDPGGETKFGISKRQFPNLDIANLTEEQAVEIYREGYWKDGYSQISSQLIADKLFDLGVLFGVHTAVAILQTTLHVAVDGVFGPHTLSAVEQADEASLLASYKANLMTHAFNVATAKPEERIFLKGWGIRINS